MMNFPLSLTAILVLALVDLSFSTEVIFGVNYALIVLFNHFGIQSKLLLNIAVALKDYCIIRTVTVSSCNCSMSFVPPPNYFG